MKHVLILLLISIFAIETANSQAWKMDRHTVIVGAGGNVFMGDLGGGAKEGAHFLGLRDVDLNSVKFTGMLGYRFRIGERLYTRANVLYSKVGGSDKNSDSDPRLARNLNFKSDLLDIGASLDYYFIREKEMSTRGINKITFWDRIAGYFFVGFSAIHFNPMGEYEGAWYELQPLCTEGQGTGAKYKVVEGGVPQLVETREPYSLLAYTVPVGIGFKYQVNRQISVGLELTQHFTTTDYIDDCSSYYFDYAKEGITPPSEMTTVFANRSGKNKPTGTVRGNRGYNDAYFTSLITVYYRFCK